MGLPDPTIDGLTICTQNGQTCLAILSAIWLTEEFYQGFTHEKLVLRPEKAMISLNIYTLKKILLEPIDNVH